MEVIMKKRWCLILRLLAPTIIRIRGFSPSPFGKRAGVRLSVAWN
jgi:hypothetical protein